MKGKMGTVVPKIASGNPNVIAEARDERKKGGKVVAKGFMAKPGKKIFGKPEGEKSKHRADRPHRKSGGAVNCTSSPFSSARSTTSAPKSAD